MSEENIVRIVVAIITLFGTLIGVVMGYYTKNKKQLVSEAKREQAQNDQFKRLFSEMTEIKKRLDTHNSYAEKFGEIEKSIVSIKKDIEYIRKDKS